MKEISLRLWLSMIFWPLGYSIFTVQDLATNTDKKPQIHLLKVNNFENWRHQKVISKLTDLYRMRCFDGNYSTHISCVTFSLNSYFTEITFDTFSINPPLFHGKSHIRIVLNCLNFLARKPASFMKKFEASSEKIT